jgi:hypothetical protein
MIQLWHEHIRGNLHQATNFCFARESKSENFSQQAAFCEKERHARCFACARVYTLGSVSKGRAQFLSPLSASPFACEYIRRLLFQPPGTRSQKHCANRDKAACVCVDLFAECPGAPLQIDLGRVRGGELQTSRN